MAKNVETLSLPKEVVDSEWRDEAKFNDLEEPLEDFEYGIRGEEAEYISPESVAESATENSLEYIKNHVETKLHLGKLALFGSKVA